jgi:hypothetical protein
MDVVDITLDSCIGTAMCESVDALLDEFAKSAADGALQRYFGTFVSPEARFLGTDVKEVRSDTTNVPTGSYWGLEV